MINRIVKVFIIFATLLLVACGPIKMPPMSTYTLAPFKPAVNPRYPKTRYTILVTTPIANPGYRSVGMVYVTVPYNLRVFANNRWVAPPASMLLPMLAQGLRRTSFFHAVVTPPFTGVANFRLVTHLIMLQQEFIRPTSQIRLIMQADLIRNTTNKILASRRFQVVVNTVENNPYGGVLAANRAATILVGRITRFTVGAIR